MASPGGLLSPELAAVAGEMEETLKGLKGAAGAMAGLTKAQKSLLELGEAAEEAEAELKKMKLGTVEYDKQVKKVKEALERTETARDARARAYGQVQAAVTAERKEKAAEAARGRQAALDAPGQVASAGKAVVGGGLGAMASLAGGPITGALSEFAGKIMSFVEALNPSAVMMFSQSLKDLQAVVGTALEPVFGVLTDAVREAADLLLPVTKQLAPVFGQIARTVMDVLQPVMQTWANQLRALVPIIQLVADVMSGVAPVMVAVQTVMAAVTRTVGDFIASLFGSGYRDAMASFKSAMQRLASAVLLTVGAMLRASQDLFGVGGRALQNLIDATRGGDRGAARGLGAATGGSVTSLQSWEQAQLAAAFTASGTAGGTRSDNEWLQEAANRLEEMQRVNAEAQNWLRQNFAAALVVLDAIKRGIDAIRGVRPAFDAAAEAAQNNPAAFAFNPLAIVRAFWALRNG